MIKTYLTDGTYSYNLYRNGDVVANGLGGNTYTDSNLPDGFYDYYVTTNYYGGESDPSNAVQVQIGDAVTQSIHFANGWNRFSTYIEADDPVAMLDMLKASLGENGLLIESADYSTEFDGEEWFGDLDDEGITNEQTYFILVNNDCTVELTGRLADPADHPITLTPGWNRIGFPCTEEVEIAVALADLEAEVEDVLESPDGYINYDGDEWFGDIDTMIPGQGYLYYSNSEETKTFVFNTGAKKVRSGKPVFWNVSVQAPTRQGCYK